MANRIHLVVDDSLLPSGVKHLIYRKSEPGVLPGPDDLPLIEFEEEQVELAPCEIIDEVLTQDEYEPNCFHTSHPICADHPNDPPPIVKINGQPVSPADFTYDAPTGRIWITNQPIPHYFEGVVTATYWYRAFLVKDCAQPQPGVLYRGPEATGLRPPQNLQVSYDPTERKIKLSWELPHEIPMYYYYLRSVQPDGNLSPWSDEVGISLIPDPTTTEFQIFRLIPDGAGGETRELIGSTKDMHFYPPSTDPVIDFAPTFTRLDTTVVGVEMENPFQRQPVPRTTPRMLVAQVDDLGAMEESDPIDPVEVVVPFERLLLRRKVHNGTPATETEIDAVTLLDVTPATAVDPTISYRDEVLNPGVYCYTLFLWDETGARATRSWVVDMLNDTVSEL